MGHIPIVLKFDDWPQLDRAMWEDLFEEGDLFDQAGPLHRFSKGSRALYRQSYGQWLSFLARTYPRELAYMPVDRITPDRVREYIDECEVRLAPASVASLIGSIDLIARVAAPGRNWSWLRRGYYRLGARARRESLPPPEPITASEIFAWSLSRLAEIALKPPTKPRAIHFRQALMIRFLISRPVRRRALLAMRVDQHVNAEPEGYRLIFSAEDMKDRRPRSFLLPQQLTMYMQAYLEIYRPRLAMGGQTSGLWLSQYGEPLTPDGFSRELPRVTERHLGVALRPHAFRHIAATSIAEFDPEHVNIIKDILGHATLSMSERHYNRARQITSADRWQNVMEDFCRRGGARTRHRLTTDSTEGPTS